MNKEQYDGFWISPHETTKNVVMALTGQWKDSFRSEIENKNVEYLRLSAANGWKETDITFLNTLKNLKGIEIYNWEVNDILPIQQLTQLEFISLECDFRKPIDFTLFPNLKTCQITWKAGAKSIFQCKNIEHLNIANYPAEDLTSINCHQELKILQLTSKKLNNLKGIDKFASLECIDLFECPNLQSFSMIESVESLRHLEVESCKGFKDIEPIGNLINLNVIVLNDCGKIESISPLKNCLSLEKVFFSGSTVIEDGDLSMLKSLPNLRIVRFVDRKHYSIKIHEIQSIIGME